MSDLEKHSISDQTTRFVVLLIIRLDQQIIKLAIGKLNPRPADEDTTFYRAEDWEHGSILDVNSSNTIKSSVHDGVHVCISGFVAPF